MSKNSTLPMGYKVDWFQCTEDGTEKILKLSESNFFRFLLEIGYENDKFQEISGRYFYEKGLTLGNYLNIFFNECENPYTKASVYFQFTGQGSTDLAQKLAVYYASDDFDLIWKNFFKLVEGFELKVTRLDIACDDFSGRLSFPKIERKLARKEFTATKRSYNIVKAKEMNGRSKGETIYFGARKRHQNGFLVRFYDKLAEYDGKGAPVPRVVRNVITGEGTGIWQRYEIEIRGNACSNFIGKYLNGKPLGKLFAGLLRNSIDFKKVSRKTKVKSRWKTVDWWEDFLQGAEKTSLTDPERDMDLGRLLRWIRVAVLPSLALVQSIGKEKDFDFYKIIQDIEIKSFSKKQERLKNDALSFSDEKINEMLDLFKEGRY